MDNPVHSFVCPHCRGTTFLMSPMFIECYECGTRYLTKSDGTLQRTTAFGNGEGSYGRAQNARAAEQAQTQVPATIHQTINYNIGTVDARQASGKSVIVDGGQRRNRSRSSSSRGSSKSRWVALTLCVLFGYLGVHYFYLGRWKMGLLYLFTIGLWGVGWMVDCLRILLAGIRDADGRRVI